MTARITSRHRGRHDDGQKMLHMRTPVSRKRHGARIRRSGAVALLGLLQAGTRRGHGHRDAGDQKKDEGGQQKKMMLFWILLALLLLTALLVCYSALVASDRADEWEERSEDDISD